MPKTKWFYVLVLSSLFAGTSEARADDPGTAAPTITTAPAVGAPSAPSVDLCPAERLRLAALDKANADMSANNATLQAQLDAQTKKVGELQESLGAAAKKVADLQDRLLTAQREQQLQATRIVDIQGRLGEANAKYQALQLQRNQLDDTRLALVKELKDAKDAGDNAWSAYAKTATERDKVQKEKEAELTAINTQLGERDRQLQTAKDDKDALGRELKKSQDGEQTAKTEATNSENALDKEQAALRVLRDNVSRAVTWIAGLAALSLLVAISRFGYKVRVDVRKARLAHAPALTDDSIAAAMTEDFFFHHIIARRLQVMILSAAIVASATALCIAVVVGVAAHDGSAGFSTILVLVNSLFWKIIAGCAAPVAALIAIYKAMQNKGSESIKLLGDLHVDIGAGPHAVPPVSKKAETTDEPE